jgi:hypothetical protein
MPDSHLHIQSGALIVHRLLDVADAIDLVHAETLWLSHAGRESRRTRLSTASTNELDFGVPPALLALPALSINIDGQAMRAEMTARLYDFGAIVIALRVDASELSWDEFVQRCNALDRATTPASQTLWRQVLREVLDVIEPALLRPTSEHLEEDYLFAVVDRFQKPMTGAQIQSQADLAALLSGETRPLSPQEAAELTRQAFSYFADDLVVVNWDRAFIYEPRRDSDVIDIIEVANAQLLEMRYYDELLDAELTTMYDLVANARGGLSLLASRRAARLARRLYSLVAEITELTEKVENSLQVTEDVYLARVYGAAMDLLRVPKLSAAVDRKLAIIRDTYTALYDEASSRRAELLELAIVLLIVFEIALALMERWG